MKAQKAALAEVKNLETKLREMLKARAFNPDYYKYSMDEVGESFDRCLRKVNELTTQYSLDDTIPLRFKKRGVEKIYAKAMERKDYEWAASFSNKYHV